MWVLQIDDDQDDLEMFGESIHLFDATVKHRGVETMEAALALFATDQLSIPAIIFLDINMPRHSGFDCYATFKKDSRFINTRFVFLSTTIHQQELPKGSAFMKKQHSVKAYVNVLNTLLHPPAESNWYTNKIHIKDLFGQSRYQLQCV
jgi:CheY-like chemotaxis protein